MSASLSELLKKLAHQECQLRDKATPVALSKQRHSILPLPLHAVTAAPLHSSDQTPLMLLRSLLESSHRHKSSVAADELKRHITCSFNK